jgi:hypothetical protein
MRGNLTALKILMVLVNAAGIVAGVWLGQWIFDAFS